MKIYLKVPYEERYVAKKAGAHWDPVVRKWYVLSSETLKACHRWAQPLTKAELEWLNDPVRKLRYQEAMTGYLATRGRL